YTFAPNFRWAGALQKAENRASNDMRGMWKSARFKILDATAISSRHIGQFRVVRGYVSHVHPWRFKLGKLSISVPRKYRQWFTAADLPQQGTKIRLRGTIRTSIKGQLYLALHSPFDME
ncbi:MAG: nuclease, partial [Mariprofundus sp.]